MNGSSNAKTRRLSKDHAYISLKQKIIDNVFEPDQIVREENLATLLGISRTPLREAIQRLENEDFLIRQTNGRLKVASITRKEVEEIFLIRSMLEGFIAKHAAQNATGEDILNLTIMLEKIKKSFQLGYSQDFVSYGFEFHDYLSEISNLKMFGKILDLLRDHALRYCNFVSLKGDWNKQADEEHSLVLQYIKEKNGEGAEKAMQDHILSSLETALENIVETEENTEGVEDK